MANVTLSASLVSVTTRIHNALQEVVERVEAQKEGEQLTVSSMVETLAQETGLDKQLLQLISSTVINGTDTHHIVPGRYGGIKKGQKVASEPKKPSEKAQLKAELEAAKAQLAALEAKQVAAAPDTEFDAELADVLAE